VGNSDASTAGLLAQRQQGQEAESESSSSAAGRRRGSKVAPEPKEQGEGSTGRALLPSTPGSPSFRYYCQKTAFVDKIVADAEASCDGSVRNRGSSLSFSLPFLSCHALVLCWLLTLLEFLGSSFSSAATTRQASNRDEVTTANAQESNQVMIHPQLASSSLSYKCHLRFHLHV
jgi:hypothetical protein